MKQFQIQKNITDRDGVSLEKYFSDITKEPLISAQEEVVLAQKIKQGDPIALEKLTKANLRFVISVAKQYQNQGLSLPDLINEGNLGLIEAAKRFDETRGFKFISYAVWRIKQSILLALGTYGKAVRIPLNRIHEGNKISKMNSKLEQELERLPTDEELADALGLPLKKILESHTPTVDSLDNILTGTHMHLLETLENPDTEERNKTSPEYALTSTSSMNYEIARVLSLLNERERIVLKLYYGLGTSQNLSLDEIGAKFGLGREGIRQVKERALHKIKSSHRAKALLKSYLG